MDADESGQKYVKHHIQRLEDGRIDQSQVIGYCHYPEVKRTIVVMDRSRQPLPRRPLDCAYHQLETL